MISGRCEENRHSLIFSCDGTVYFIRFHERVRVCLPVDVNSFLEAYQLLVERERIARLSDAEFAIE